jgi:hypothetical protein
MNHTILIVEMASRTDPANDPYNFSLNWMRLLERTRRELKLDPDIEQLAINVWQTKGENPRPTLDIAARHCAKSGFPSRVLGCDKYPTLHTYAAEEPIGGSQQE